jgi:hypothetical protein
VSYLIIQFERPSPSGRTAIFDVQSKTGVHLGDIKWFAPWRRYTFTPIDGNTVFDSACLKEITQFIDKQMEERRAARRTAKGSA